MLLYATVTSERASKGQGGNKQLNIDILIDDKVHPRFKLFITRREDDSTDIVLVDMEKPFPNSVYEQTLKGKKQKGDVLCDCGQGEYAHAYNPHHH